MGIAARASMLEGFRAHDTAIEFYWEFEKLKCPKHLQDQLLRASSSIALNLSEGSAKPTRADRRRIYFIALGSLRESQTILRLVRAPTDSKAFVLADMLGAQIFKRCEALKSQNA
jgi:four helix bundle protein